MSLFIIHLDAIFTELVPVKPSRLDLSLLVWKFFSALF